MFRYLTSGESHGKRLTTIIDGMPSGLRISAADINTDLRRRQGGYGRGARMAIEKDVVEITSGIRHGVTLGSPIGLTVENRDWENWEGPMNSEAIAVKDKKQVTKPRPGHADLPGALKYDHRDVRNILERSSARETAARVAAGGVARRFLDEFGITVRSWVVGLGGVSAEVTGPPARLFKAAEASPLRCPDKIATEAMKRTIDLAKENGDSLGGIFEVSATGVPPGLGTHVQWDRKLNARIAMAIMSIQAIKGVEIGMGFDAARNPGSRVQDEIFYRAAKAGRKKVGGFWPETGGFYRKTNNAGGLEGGTTNGEPLVLRAAMKPIPTLYKPLRSVDIGTKKPYKASVERSDVCAVPAASIIGEAVVAIELADAFLLKFGGDSIREISRNYKGYLKQVRDF